MKRYGAMLAMAAVMVTGSAMADYRPGYDRPLAQSDLVSTQRTFPRPTHLMTSRKDGGFAAITTITLTEDTGIRCVTVPCPSERTTTFAVYGQPILLPGNSVQYSAVQNLLVTGPLGRPRYVQRTLTLVDHSNSVLGIARPYAWEVTVRQGLMVVGTGAGNPEPIYTTQGFGVSNADESANDDALLAE